MLPPDTNQWLHEGLAEWAAVRAENAIGGLEQNPGRTMDCVGSVCGDTEFDQNGYPGGCSSSTSPNVSATARSSPSSTHPPPPPPSTGTQALSAVVQPLGTTLGKFFEDYTTARMTGNFTSELLAGVLPQTQGSIVVGSKSGAISPVTLAVNHLAVRYVDLAHGADTDTGPLLLGLTRAQGRVASRRRLDALLLRKHEGRDRPAVPQLAGSSATLTVPWNTCAASPHAYVSLPNETNGNACSACTGRT